MYNRYKMCPLYILPHWSAFKAKVQSLLERLDFYDLNFYYFTDLPHPKNMGRCQVANRTYSSLKNAKKACNSGYSVFDSSGKAVYTPQISFAKGQRVTLQNAPLFSSDSVKNFSQRKSPVRTTSMMARSVPTADIGLPTLPPIAEKPPVGSYVTGYVSYDNFK